MKKYIGGREENNKINTDTSKGTNNLLQHREYGYWPPYSTQDATNHPKTIFKVRIEENL